MRKAGCLARWAMSPARLRPVKARLHRRMPATHRTSADMTSRSFSCSGGLAACAAAALLSLTAGAHAQLADARLLSGPEPMLWLSFDAQPGAVATESADGSLTLRISGVAPERRRIEPSVGGLVRLITLEPQGAGVVVRLAGGWTDAAAELRRGGVLVRFDPRTSNSREPARAPIAEPVPDVQADGSGPTVSEPVAAAPAERRAGAPAPIAQGPQDAVSGAGPQAGPERLCPSESAVVDSDPWNLEALLAQARCFSEAGETGAAALVLERVLAFQPDQFDAALELGRIRERQGDLQAAQALYEQAAGSALTDGNALRARRAAQRAAEAQGGG